MTPPRLDLQRPQLVLPEPEALDQLNIEALVGALTQLGALTERARARLAMTAALRPDATTPRQALLRTDEVATLLGVSKDYVYREAKRWPFTRRIGRVLRFDPAGLARWQAARRSA